MSGAHKLDKLMRVPIKVLGDLSSIKQGSK